MKSKVFGVGLGKSGTTTLGSALTILGYNHFGWRRGLTPEYYEKGLNAVMSYAREYDSFEDFPWPLIYKELDKAFPDAKFILTKRINTNIWYNSLKTHRNRNKHGSELIYIFGYDRPQDAAEFHKDFYERHNAAVTAYFSSRPEKLLTVCWEQGDGWDELCAFLLKSPPDLPFPHVNQTPGIWRRFLNFIQHSAPGYSRKP